MLKRVPVKEYGARVRAQQEAPHRQGRPWGSFDAGFERVKQGRARYGAEAQGYLGIFQDIDGQTDQRRHLWNTPLVAADSTRTDETVGESRFHLPVNLWPRAAVPFP